MKLWNDQFSSNQQYVHNFEGSNSIKNIFGLFEKYQHVTNDDILLCIPIINRSRMISIIFL